MPWPGLVARPLGDGGGEVAARAVAADRRRTCRRSRCRRRGRLAHSSGDHAVVEGSRKRMLGREPVVDAEHRHAAVVGEAPDRTIERLDGTDLPATTVEEHEQLAGRRRRPDGTAGPERRRGARGIASVGHLGHVDRRQHVDDHCVHRGAGLGRVRAPRSRRRPGSAVVEQTLSVGVDAASITPSWWSAVRSSTRRRQAEAVATDPHVGVLDGVGEPCRTTPARGRARGCPTEIWSSSATGRVAIWAWNVRWTPSTTTPIVLLEHREQRSRREVGDFEAGAPRGDDEVVERRTSATLSTDRTAADRDHVGSSSARCRCPATRSAAVSRFWLTTVVS